MSYAGGTEQEIRQARWSGIGHTLRKPVDSITRQSLTWNLEGKGKEDDRETHVPAIWKQTSKKLATPEWRQLERLAQNRIAWMSHVGGLCSRRSDELRL